MSSFTPNCFNPSPVCGTGEIKVAKTADDILKFQSVSGLWDRRNLLTRVMASHADMFQSVSGLWDRRNHHGTD